MQDDGSDMPPATKSGVASRLHQVEQEMQEAFRERNFEIVRQKEEELQKLEVLRDLMLSENPQESIESLNAEIENCGNARNWGNAEFLHQVATSLSRAAGAEEERFGKKCLATDSTDPRTKGRHGCGTERSISSSSSSLDGAPPVFGRLVVLQAHPLVYHEMNNGKKGKIKRLEPLNLEEEKKQILDGLSHAKTSGGRIDVSFEPATTLRLSGLLSSDDVQALHYSGHGNNQYICMEDRGALQPLMIEDLKELMSTGLSTTDLRFVFLSACKSLDVGKAFIAAGIPRVICCHEDVYGYEGSVFTQHFYMQLAKGQTLLKAFNMAKKAVEIRPQARDPRFILLPEGNDEHHNIQLFSNAPGTHVPKPNSEIQPPIGLLPSMPYPFYGRQIEMYSVVEHLLQSERLVQITGVPGVGKTTLGHAVCSYIEARKDAFLFENIIWLPFLDNMDRRNDLRGSLTEMIELVGNDKVPVGSNNYRQSVEKVAHRVPRTSTLIFLDCAHRSSTPSVAKVRYFLEVLFRETSCFVVLITPPGEEIVSKVIPFHARVWVGRLDMRSSVLLFAKRCQFVSREVSPGIRSPEDLDDLLVPDSQADATEISSAMSQRCIDIFSLIGGGNPNDICKQAETISQEKYLELIKVGKIQDFQRQNYDTRFAVDQAWVRIDKELKMSDGYDNQRDQELEDTLQKLEHLRESLPSLEDLLSSKQKIFLSLKEAALEKDEERVTELQKQLSECREKIKREEDAIVDSAQDGQPMSPTASFANYSTAGLPHLSMYTIPSPKRLLPKDVGTFTLVVELMPVTEFSYLNGKCAIVCPTNESCFPARGSVSEAVITAGGDAFLKTVNKLESGEWTNWGPVRCPTGEARIVGPAKSGRFGKLGVAWVVFAVGPTYSKDDESDTLKQKDVLLRASYSHCFNIAKEKGFEAVAFSLISGGFRAGGDLRRPLRIAMECIVDSGYKELKKVQLCAFTETEAALLNDIAREMGLSQGTAPTCKKETKNGKEIANKFEERDAL